MAVSIYAANEGYLKDIELNKVLDFEAALLSYMNSEHGDLLASINESGDWNDEIEAQFKAGITSSKKLRPGSWIDSTTNTSSQSQKR